MSNLPKIIISVTLWCPHCGKRHVDETRDGERWDRRAHTTHRCQACGDDFDVYVSGSGEEGITNSRKSEGMSDWKILPISRHEAEGLGRGTEWLMATETSAQRITELERERDELLRQLARRQDEFADALSRLNRAQTALAAKDQRIADLKTQVERLRERHAATQLGHRKDIIDGANALAAERAAREKAEAGAAALREALELVLPLAKGYAPAGQSDTARRTCDSWISAAEDALSTTTAGKALLEERERLRNIIREITDAKAPFRIWPLDQQLDWYKRANAALSPDEAGITLPPLTKDQREYLKDMEQPADYDPSVTVGGTRVVVGEKLTQQPKTDGERDE